MKVLDCTLRDGGYYNNWDFEPDVAADAVSGLVDAGVDVIELGYKSTERSGFNGLFRYCNEDQLRAILPPLGETSLAFMVDAKEFLKGADSIDDGAIRAAIPDASESVFSLARVATHANTIRGARNLAGALKDRGYDVALNIMGISTLDKSSLDATMLALDGAPIDVLYLADSYGSMTPTETAEKVKALQRSFPGAIGVHMHENQGLALANTMAALEAGATYVDATLSGMGRGAGNTRTEQLLLALYFQQGRKDLRPSAVLHALQRHFLPMQQRYGWGWDFSYMLSGLVQIHPTYCQELKAGSRYDVSDVVAILEDIPVDKRARFSPDELLKAEERYGQRLVSSSGDLVVGGALDPVQSNEVIVVANGPSARRHASAIKVLAERRNATVIECNDTGFLDGMKRTTIVLNPVRLAELVARKPHDEARVLGVGVRHTPSELAREQTFRLDYALRAGRFCHGQNGSGIVLPGFVVGMLAIAAALQAQPRRVLLAGFDGFSGTERRAEQAEMEAFWALVRDTVPSVEILSVTPTSYAIPTTSAYVLLQDGSG